jgi:uncharacterized membrane protein
MLTPTVSLSSQAEQQQHSETSPGHDADGVGKASYNSASILHKLQQMVSRIDVCCFVELCWSSPAQTLLTVWAVTLKILRRHDGYHRDQATSIRRAVSAQQSVQQHVSCSVAVYMLYCTAALCI